MLVVLFLFLLWLGGSLLVSRFFTALNKTVTLEGVLAAKALLTVIARERLDCKMYALVPLEVVVPAKALWALVTLEGPLLLWGMVCTGLVVMVGQKASRLSHSKHRYPHTRELV